MPRSISLPTYADIALKAGVSTKTVCNVIRYPDVVRKQTGERVVRALAELGVTDLSVMKSKIRLTRSAQSKSLLFLESGMPAGALSTPVFGSIVHAAESLAHEKGWQLNLRRKSPDEFLPDALRHFKGEGVILFGKSTTYEELNSVFPGVAAVRLLESPEEGTDCDHVDYDRREVSKLAALHLKKMGCKKVAYLGVPDIRGRALVQEGADAGLQVIDGTVGNIYKFDGSSQVVDREVLEAAWKKIARSRPDGLFVHSDQITNALYGLLNSLKIRPQKDIQIVSCNNEAVFLSPLDPRPTTIDIHPAEIGRRGIEFLLARIQTSDAPPSSVIIRPKLIPGEVAR